jgi:hypothetical protein
MVCEITTIRLGSRELDKWMHQNQAEYTGDFVEGCLLDCFVLWCKRGVAAVYEHALNDWSSEYLVEFQRGDGHDVWERWYEFEDEATRIVCPHCHATVNLEDGVCPSCGVVVDENYL